jgi:WD40 repeat protein
MPRPEQPIEGTDALAGLASGLRKLRQEAGSPPYRALARRAHFSSTTLAEAAAGRRLPTLAVTLAYVQACGGDAAEWTGRWHRVAGEVAFEEAEARDGAAGEPSGADECPYVGLAAFAQRDSARFFGRERLTGDLVARVGSRRFTALFGASGSGKTSLLRAGLLPRLAAEPPAWEVVLFTPGAHPLDECAARVAALDGLDVAASALRRELDADPRALHLAVAQASARRRPDEARAEALIVVDQFEEVFTLCADPDERAAFISTLLTATAEPNSRTRLVIGMRADFYPRCADHPLLAQALSDAQVLVGPMSVDELHRAVTRPAAVAHCAVESALLARIVADAHGHPNALPLISHALRETWRRRRGNTMTLTGYEAAGGMQHALARTAEAFYEELDEDLRELARGILLRLVAPGEGAEDTRQRVPRAEFESPDTVAVLEALIRARLVAQDADTVELTHEALLTAWPRLRSWVEQDRAGLLVHRRLADAAEAWEREGRDPAALYRGHRLAAAVDWDEQHADQRGLPPHPRVRQFLAAAVRHERRIRRLRRAAITALAALTVVALGTAGVAVQQRSTAQTERDQAIAGQVFAESQQLRSTDPSLAAQLTLASYRISPSADADTALLDEQNATLSNVLAVSGSPVYAVAYSPHGNILASGSEDGTLRLWRTSDMTHPSLWTAPINLHQQSIYWLAFSPNGRVLATADADATAELWNVSDPAHPVRLGAPLAGHDEYVFSVSFSADGDLLATASADHTVRFWDVADPAHATQVGVPIVESANIASAVFSPVGRTLAVAGHDSTLRLWDIADPSHPVQLGPALSWDSEVVYAAAFSPDGTILAAASADQTARLWNISDPTHPVALGAPLTGHANILYAVAFSPNGTILATGSADETIRLWDISDPTHPVQIGAPLTGHAGFVYWLAFSPDGRTLASASADGTVRVWTIPPTVLLGQTGAVDAVAFSPNGRLLAGAGSDDRLLLWNTADPQNPALLSATATGDTQPITSALFSPMGHILATISADDTARLWDITNPEHPVLLAALLAESTGTLTGVAFSPDGRILATSGTDNLVRLWDIADTAHPAPIGRPLSGHDTVAYNAVPNYWIGFSPNGRLLASVGPDDRLLLWNVADPAHPTRIDTVDTNTNGANAAAFSLDGQVLATAGGNDTVRLWNLASPAHTALIGAPLTGHTSAVTWVGFSPGGRMLASTGSDGTVRLWSVNATTDGSSATGATAYGQPLTDHTAPVEAGAFSPNGQLLATAGADDTIELTSLDVNQAITRVCAATADTLTPAIWHQEIPDLPYMPVCG